VASLKGLEGEVAALKLLLCGVKHASSPSYATHGASLVTTQPWVGRPPHDPLASTNVSDDEDDEPLPRSVLTAPIETLNRLAEREATGHADPASLHPRKRARHAYETTIPPVPELDIIQKGVVSEEDARELYST
jgi:hypothetical protein